MSEENQTDVDDSLPLEIPYSDDPSLRLMDDMSDDVTDTAGYAPLVIDNKRVCRRCARPLGPGKVDNLNAKPAFCADCAPTIITLLVQQSRRQRDRVAAIESISAVPDTRGYVPGRRYVVLTPARNDSWNVFRRFVMPERRIEREVTRSERCEVMFTDLESAMRAAGGGSVGGDPIQDPLGHRVLEFDIADIIDHNATPEQRYQHAQRLMMHYTAEEKRLRPAEHGKPVVPSEFLTKDIVQIATDIILGPSPVPDGEVPGSARTTHKCRGCHAAMTINRTSQAVAVCTRCAYGAVTLLAHAVIAAHQLLVTSQEHDYDQKRATSPAGDATP